MSILPKNFNLKLVGIIKHIILSDEEMLHLGTATVMAYFTATDLSPKEQATAFDDWIAGVREIAENDEHHWPRKDAI